MEAELASTRSRAIVPFIDAGIVGRTVDRNSDRISDRFWNSAGRIAREGRSEFDGTTLFFAKGANVFGHFREVLIQAEEDGGVIVVPVGASECVDSDTHVNAFFLSVTVGVGCAIGQVDGFGAVAKRSGERLHSTLAHCSKFSLPKTIPTRAITRPWDAGVETDLEEIPLGLGADREGKRVDVIIGEVIVEGAFSFMEKILAVNERNGLQWDRHKGGGDKRGVYDHKKTHPGLAACRMGKKLS
jgi:hypothetical protein